MQYRLECWATKNEHFNKMNATKMSMLRWMCVKTGIKRIRNDNIRDMKGVAPIEDKLKENRRPIYAMVKTTDEIVVDGNSRGRGRPKLAKLCGGKT